MQNFFKIILILAIALIIGFYLGLSNRQVEVRIVNPQDHPTAVSGKFDVATIPWYVSRSSAIAAYILMFIVIIWGLGMTTGSTYKLTNPVNSWHIHKYMSISMGVLILIHAFSLLLDKYINFHLKDILIPFASSYKTTYLSLGIISFYVFFIVILTSLLLRIRSPKFWRFVHYLTYPIFIASLVHGLYLGTDSHLPVMQILYWSTGIVFILSSSYRLISFQLKK